MSQDPSKEELLKASPGSIDTESLSFDGTRGDKSRHMDRAALEAGIAAMAGAPKDVGTVDLMVSRPGVGERVLLKEAMLTKAGGMPGDRWAEDDRYGPEYQLATTQTDYARFIANGQPMELHGDNLFLTLDLSEANLPVGSVLAMGEAKLVVTPKPHNGCKKWVQRFGLDVMQLNMHADYKARNVRGIYLRVEVEGMVRQGDEVRVLSR